MLLAAMCVGLALRLYHLAGESIWYDESITIVYCRIVDWDLSFLSSSEARIVPLFALMGALWLHSVEWIASDAVSHDYVIRLLCALLSLAILPGTYRMALVLFKDRGVAIAASAFVAISPFQIFYAQEFRPHTLYALLTLWAMYNAYLALEHGKRRHWVGTALFGALAFYAYYFAAVYLVCINVFAALCFKRYWHRVVPWVLSQLATIALIVPAGFMALQQWGQFSAAEEHWFPKPTLKHILLSLKVYVAGYTPNAALYYVLLVFTVILIAIGVYARRKDRVQLAFLGSMSLAPILFQIVAWSTQDFGFFTYRIQLPYSIPIFILLGMGLTAIKPRPLGGIVAIAFALLTAPTLLDYYRQDLHPSWNHRIGARYKIDSRSAAAFVEAKWREGDFVAHTATQTYSPFRDHYFHNQAQSVAGFTDEERQGLLRSVPTEELWDYLGFFPRRVEDIAEDADRIWFVHSWWEPFAPEPIPFELRAWFDAHYVRVGQWHFDGLHLYLYEKEMALLDRVPTVTNGLDTVPRSASSDTETLDDQMELLAGYQPLALAQQADGNVLAKNVTDTETKVEAVHYPVAAFVPIIEMERPPNSDVWRVSSLFQHNQTMSARVGTDESAALTKRIELPSGPLVVLLRMNTRTEEYNTDRAMVSMSLTTAESTWFAADVHGHRPGDSEDGWRWVHVGEFESDGGEVILALDATNPDGLTRSFFDAHQMVFVRPDDVSSLVSPSKQTFTLPPKTWVEIPIESAVESPATLHIEVTDVYGNGYRLFR